MEEILTPVWDGDISYMESVFPVENKNGDVEPIRLLYPIEEIIKVQNASLTTTYQEGVDYAVAGGKLIVAEDGNIPITTYEEFHPTTGEIESVEGGKLCFHEGSWFHERQIVVTYRHSAVYEGYIPEGKGNLLPNLHEKLQNKEDIELLVFGDSISVGANASGYEGINVSPWLPTYAELFGKTLASQYGVRVHLTNPSVGGKTTDWGLSEIDGVLEKQNGLDLAVIAFGANDVNLSLNSYATQINAIVSKIKKAYPNADVVLVATMLPNKQAKGFYGNQEKFQNVLLSDCEREGVAVANITKLHASLLDKKRYVDMTGNNVNHPNDYLTRIYVQALMKTLAKEEYIPNEESSKESVTSETVEENPLKTLLNGCNGTISASAGGGTALVGMALMGKKRNRKNKSL